MSEIKYSLSKEEFKIVHGLYMEQPWIMDRENEFMDLFELYDRFDQRVYITELLKEFQFLSNSELNNFLQKIAQYIIIESGFEQSKTQISAITYDDEADSSQKMVDYIKMPLFQQGWDSVKTVNRFGSIPKNVKEGRNQILVIDEFVGSGKTIEGRIKQLKNDIKIQFDLKFCFLAGMETGLRRIENLGYEVFCPLRLKQGISERYVQPQLDQKIEFMILLEEELADEINNFKLANYSFGYGGAEALYSLEGANGNTPNSVFPVFWWPRLKNGDKRNTLLTRFEKGLK